MTQKRLSCYFSVAESSSQLSIAETVQGCEAETVTSGSGSEDEVEPDSSESSGAVVRLPGSNGSSCTCQCCAQPGTPYQPLEVSNSKTAHAHHSKERKMGQLKTYSRRIQPSWYEKHPWISVCTSTYKIFCSTCRSAKELHLLTFSKHQKSAFIEDGFGNWRKALQRFQEHEKSDMHKEATEKVAARSSGRDVLSQLNAQHAADTMFHRKMLMKLLSCIKFLARQGLALRGSHEDADSLEGNLYQLLLLQAQEEPAMKLWLRKKEYISPDIVNELIMMMGQAVLRQILKDVREALWFSLIADEASDISHNEHLSISIRWVENSYGIHEDNIGLIQLPDTKAQTLFSVIKDVLIRCSLPLSQCRGQAFDGASNMSGIHNGVQALIKREERRAVYVHCLAHSLNLCVQEVAKKCITVRDIMDFIFELVQLIKFSPKRSHLFESLRKDVVINGGESTPRLRTLCPTRWTVRHSSINAILLNYEILQATLAKIREGHDEYAAKANGLHARMELFDTYFGLKLSHLFFSAAEQFSTNLQAKNISVQEATHGAELLVSHLRSLRTDAQFNRFYEQVLSLSSSLTEEPRLPRVRKLPKRFDQGEHPHKYASPKDKYRQTYFETLDLAVGEVERRFQQSDLHIVKDIENLLLNAANRREIEPISDVVTKFLENDIDPERFKVQLLMVADMIKTAYANSTPVIKVTNVRTISEAMVQSEIYKGMLSEIDKVLKLYFTFPVTSATAERSFSSLRRIKTFLRNSMTQCRLNNLFILYVHTSRTDELNLTEIASDFVHVNSRRTHYFGSF